VTVGNGTSHPKGSWPVGEQREPMRIAVPNKGRLHDPSIELLERAGLHLEGGADRKLYANTVDPDVTALFARAADIPEYVADGAAAVGITGLDQVRESGHDLVDLLDLEFGRCRLVVAAPEDGDISSVADLEGGTVATEFPRITRDFFDERGVDAEVVEVTGATELTPHVDMADAIVDITSTGTTLRVNRLAEIEEVLASSVRLFAHPDAVDDEKVQQLLTAFESVLAAEDRRYVMLNVPEERLDDVRDVLPGMGGPTVMDVAGSDDVAVHAVVEEQAVFGVINDLKTMGASDILVTEIERLVE
jgi:ATP phosphoribosyltransferase